MNTCTLNINDYHFFFYIQAWFWVKWSVRWCRWRLWPSGDPPCCPAAVLTAFPHEATAAFLLPWREGRTVEGTCSGDCGPVWLHFPPKTVHADWTSMQSCLHSVGQTTNPPECTDPRTHDGDFNSVDNSACLFPGSSRSASPATSSDSRRGSTSPSPMGTLTKNETFQTPPSSPMPPRHTRGRLEKEPSFERSSLSPSSQRSELGDGGGDGVFGGVGSSPRFSSPVRMGR